MDILILSNSIFWANLPYPKSNKENYSDIVNQFITKK